LNTPLLFVGPPWWQTRATIGKHAGKTSDDSFGLTDLAELPYLGQNLPY